VTGPTALPISVVAVSGGESTASRTRTLAASLLAAAGGGQLVDLIDLAADGLLGRAPDPTVDAAVAAASAADVLVLASPIYRASVSGAMKAFLDRFSTNALRGTVVVLAATAAAPQHYLALDTSGRALVASLGGTSTATVVYATALEFVDGEPGPGLLEVVERAATEAVALARGLRHAR
jgi:FMN reductase